MDTIEITGSREDLEKLRDTLNSCIIALAILKARTGDEYTDTQLRLSELVGKIENEMSKPLPY